jgi:hypothetical protein
MSNKKINEVPSGDETLTNDDILLGMDSPDTNGVTKKISIEALSNYVMNISQENFLNLSSDNAVICSPGDNIVEKYNKAKILTPNGQPRDWNNRVTLVFMPGVYQKSCFGPATILGSSSTTFSAFVLDEPYIDIVGLGSSSGGGAIRNVESSLYSPAFNQFDYVHGPNFPFSSNSDYSRFSHGVGCTCSVVFKTIMVIVSNDTIIRGISTINGPTLGRWGAPSFPGWVIADENPNQLFSKKILLIECISNEGFNTQHFDINANPPVFVPGAIEGNHVTYINCMSAAGWNNMGDETFCYNCYGYSIRGLPYPNNFTNLRGGVYVNCHGDFINNATISAFNGVYINCTGKFGKEFSTGFQAIEYPEVTLSGYFKGCTGAFKGITSGYFENCTGLYKNPNLTNDVAFAPHPPLDRDGDWLYEPQSFAEQNTTGTFIRCNSSSKFPLTTGAGKMVLCIDGDYNVVNAGQSTPE